MSSEHESHDPAGHESAAGRVWTIVFVDDDRDFLDAQAAYFGSRGHIVHTVESSQEAVAFLETTTPDIVFLDLMMERYDSGFRLAHRIRKDERLAGIPIVMLSGVARETGQRFDQEGQGLLAWSRLDRFVDKPATGKQLLAIAEELLGAGDDKGGAPAPGPGSERS
jgi:CheY-like chemotaxis protein